MTNMADSSQTRNERASMIQLPKCRCFGTILVQRKGRDGEVTPGLTFACRAKRFRNAIDCTKFYSRSRNAVICVYDEAGNVIETREHSAPEALQRCGVDSV